MEKKENELTINIIITVFAIIIILGLSFLYYYYAIKLNSFSELNLTNNTASVSLSEKTNPEDFTKVINFSVPETLPELKKYGKCWTNSVAYPYRKDAFRCIIQNSVYDPCFTTNQEGVMFCQMNPLKNSEFIIEITENLPVAELPSEMRENWAWFVLLKDGTYCSPYTGTRPFVEKNIAYYGCNSEVEDETIVLFGELKKGNVWKTTKATLIQEENKWKIKSSKVVEIDSVWQ